MGNQHSQHKAAGTPNPTSEYIDEKTIMKCDRGSVSYDDPPSVDPQLLAWLVLPFLSVEALFPCVSVVCKDFNAMSRTLLKAHCQETHPVLFHTASDMVVPEVTHEQMLQFMFDKQEDWNGDMFQNYEMLVEIRCGGRLFLHGVSRIFVSNRNPRYSRVAAGLEELPVPKPRDFYSVNGFRSERYKNYACRAVLRCIPTGKMVTLVNYSLSCPDMPILGGAGHSLLFNPRGICTVEVLFFSNDRRGVKTAYVKVDFQNFHCGRDSEFVKPQEFLEAIRRWKLDTD